jgi:hypothetical protein
LVLRRLDARPNPIKVARKIARRSINLSKANAHQTLKSIISTPCS